MKKALVILLVMALMGLVIPAALADGDPNDTQIITGNPEGTLNLVAPTDITDWNLQVPDPAGAENINNDDGADNLVTVISNVQYDVEIQSDTDATKTSPNMWQYATGAYVNSGLFLQYALRLANVNDGGALTEVTGTSVNIAGYIDRPATDNDGDNEYVDIEQRTDYGDDRLVAANGGGAYRLVLTYTATDST